MDVNDGTHVGLVFFGAMKIVIDWEEMFCGEVVRPFDRDGLVSPGFDDGAGRGAVIAPHSCRRKVTMNFRKELPHFESIVTSDFEDRERIYKFFERARIQRWALSV